jgi:hypothetical protein
LGNQPPNKNPFCNLSLISGIFNGTSNIAYSF